MFLIVMLAGRSNARSSAPAGEVLETTVQTTATPTDPEETTAPTTVPIETTGAIEPRTESVETQPPATEPPTTDPPTTVPSATEVPTESPETESTTVTTPPTEPTEAAKETIDIASIETSANAYAASLGYIIDTSLQKGNCGYYPPDYRPLTKTVEGIKAAKELVDAITAQLNSRFTTEHGEILVEEAYSCARASYQVEFSHTDELGDWYLIYIYYG